LKARGFKLHTGMIQESSKSMKKALKKFYDGKYNGVGFPKFKTKASFLRVSDYY